MSTNRIGKIIHEVLVLPTQCETKVHRTFTHDGTPLVVFWAPGLKRYINSDASAAYRAGKLTQHEVGRCQQIANSFEDEYFALKEMRRIGGQDGKC